MQIFLEVGEQPSPQSKRVPPVILIKYVASLSIKNEARAFGVFKDKQNKQIFICANPLNRLVLLRFVMGKFHRFPDFFNEIYRVK